MGIQFGKFRQSDFDGALFVTDEKISKLYGISGDNVFILPCGEQAKCFDCVRQMCSWFLSKHLNPNGRVVAVGGGSVGDAVGFACSVYKRGVSLVQVPTTLVAMVDSAIGGKTAIDLDGVKNAIGSYFRSDTLIDTDFLRTLDDEQMTSGLGEVLKYRMLDASVDSIATSGEALSQTISACVHFKEAICEIDPYCKGKRNVLNFGHTVGHAMELALNIPHGVAVANGIYYETILAAELGLCSSQYADKWCGEVQKNFPLYPLTAQMLCLALQDKKNIDGNVSFVLPSEFALHFVPLERATKTLIK